MAELVDALDSKSCTFGCAGSIPASGTKSRVRNRATAKLGSLLFSFSFSPASNSNSFLFKARAKLGSLLFLQSPTPTLSIYRARTTLGFYPSNFFTMVKIVAMATVSPVSSYTSTKNLTIPFGISSSLLFS